MRSMGEPLVCIFSIALVNLSFLIGFFEVKEWKELANKIGSEIGGRSII